MRESEKIEAAELLNFLEGVPYLLEHAKRRDGRGGVELQVDITGPKDGCNMIHSRSIPRRAGAMVILSAEKIIRAQLKLMGVKVGRNAPRPRRPSRKRR